MHTIGQTMCIRGHHQSYPGTVIGKRNTVNQFGLRKSTNQIHITVSTQTDDAS